VIGLDTNVVGRYLAQDDLQQSAISSRLIEQELSPENPGFVPLVVLAELAWVLEDCYRLSRADTGSLLARLLRARQVRVQDPDSAWQALSLFQSGRADFADCLVAETATAAGCIRTVTFDRLAARDAGIQLLVG
jgi:predicted nucleic-acid-binding protein